MPTHFQPLQPFAFVFNKTFCSLHSFVLRIAPLNSFSTTTTIMQLTTAFTAALGLVGCATAMPSNQRRTTVSVSTDCCLTQDVATQIVSQFDSLLTNYSNNTANNILANDFSYTSDSTNFLAGIPLGSTTFPSKAAFEASQSQQANIELSVIAIDAVTCNVIAYRWNAGVASHKDPVKGINILYAEFVGSDPDAVGPKGWQVGKAYSEFNSAAWVIDIGGTCTV